MQAWQVSASRWQSMMGVHQPWIGEISGVQLSKMSKRGRAAYDRKRDEEWRASAAMKGSWRDLVIEAFENGEFTLEHPELDRDAWGVIISHQADQKRAEKEAAFEEKLRANKLRIEDLRVGDRVFTLIGGHYGIVTKVSKKSARMRYETDYLKDAAPTKIQGNTIQRLSYNDLKAEFEKEWSAK